MTMMPMQCVYAAELAKVEAKPRPSKLFIGGLTQSTTTKLMRSHFSKYGRITDCVAMRNPEGKPRGFGYVSFESSAAAEACVAEPQVVDGRTVDVKWAVPASQCSDASSESRTPRTKTSSRADKAVDVQSCDSWSDTSQRSKVSGLGWRFRDDSGSFPPSPPPGLEAHKPYSGLSFPAATWSSSMWNSSWENTVGLYPSEGLYHSEALVSKVCRRSSSPSNASTRSSSHGAEVRFPQDHGFVLPCFADSDYDEIDEDSE